MKNIEATYSAVILLPFLDPSVLEALRERMRVPSVVPFIRAIPSPIL